MTQNINSAATPPLIVQGYQLAVQRMLELDRDMIEGLKQSPENNTSALCSCKPSVLNMPRVLVRAEAVWCA